MKFRSAILCLIFLSFGNLALSEDYLIIPGIRVGDINPNSSEADLKKSYGDAEVIGFEVPLGEGETKPGTVVFPNDSKKRIEILWIEPNTKRNPERIQISGRDSIWHTAEGISIGTDLKKLEKINGKPFGLAGFNWDYAGTVLSWKGSIMEKPFQEKGRVLLRLIPSEKFKRTPDILKVSGEKEILSSHHLMQKMNPSVYQIIVNFEKTKIQPK